MKYKNIMSRQNYRVFHCCSGRYLQWQVLWHGYVSPSSYRHVWLLHSSAVLVTKSQQRMYAVRYSLQATAGN